MDPNSTAILAQRVRASGRQERCSGGVVSCLAVTGFAAAVHGAGVASSIQFDIVSADHAHKGDRLQLAPKNISTVSSPVVITLSRPPIGCEPAFSRVADPKRSHTFGRCIS